MSSVTFTPLPAPLGAFQTNAVTKIAGENGGYPCRRCLKDGQPGEEMLLFSYDPFLNDTPYRGATAIFVHKRPCSPQPEDGVPEQQRLRHVALRGYDKQHMMVFFDTMEGAELGSAAGQMFNDPSVEYGHVYYSKPGCFAIRVDRGT